MNTIPTMPFKFKHVKTNREYTLEGWLGGKLKVSWDLGGFGGQEYTTYSMVDAMYYLSLGDWKVLSQPTQECPHSIIEELECKIESLEELISEQAARIRELEAPQDDGVFKPVSEYTLKDWKQAALFEWRFKCRGGYTVTIDQIDLDEGCRPVLCSAGWYHSINGMWDEYAGEDIDDIIERIE